MERIIIRQFMHQFLAGDMDPSLEELKACFGARDNWSRVSAQMTPKRLSGELKYALWQEVEAGMTNSHSQLKESLGVVSIKHSLGLGEPEETCPLIDTVLSAAEEFLSEIKREREEFDDVMRRMEEIKLAQAEGEGDERQDDYDQLERQIAELRGWSEVEIGDLEQLIIDAEKLREACSSTRLAGKETLRDFYNGLESFEAAGRLFYRDHDIETHEYADFTGVTAWKRAGWNLDLGEAAENL